MEPENTIDYEMVVFKGRSSRASLASMVRNKGSDTYNIIIYRPIEVTEDQIAQIAIDIREKHNVPRLDAIPKKKCTSIRMAFTQQIYKTIGQNRRKSINRKY